jgi:hypothetical protein
MPRERGRRYLSKGSGHPIDAGWYLLDPPRGFRVIELDVGLGRCDPSCARSLA